MYTTETWVIHEIPAGTKEPSRLRKEAFSFGDLSAREVLIEPIFGSWEGNRSAPPARVGLGRRYDAGRAGARPRWGCRAVMPGNQL